MIARPVTRPRPIPFAAPGPGATSTRPVSWAGSSASLQSAPKAASAATVTAIVTARRSPVLVSKTATPTPPTADAEPAATAKQAAQLSAKFMGQGALSVRSSVTGRHYRFQGHGDSQAIDKHDMLMLKRIPDLVVL